MERRQMGRPGISTQPELKAQSKPRIGTNNARLDDEGISSHTQRYTDRTMQSFIIAAESALRRLTLLYNSFNLSFSLPKKLLLFFFFVSFVAALVAGEDVELVPAAAVPFAGVP